MVPGHGHPELFLKLPSMWCILKGVLPYSQVNIYRKQTQYVNMLMGRSSYDVAIWAYFERDGPPLIIYQGKHCKLSMAKIKDVKID